jgi:hypothetical protein
MVNVKKKKRRKTAMEITIHCHGKNLYLEQSIDIK